MSCRPISASDQWIDLGMRETASVNAPSALIQHFLLHVGGLQSDRPFACNLMQTCNGKTPRAASSSPGSPTLDNRAPLPSPKDSLSIAAVQIKAWQTRAGFDDVFCSDTQKLAQTMCDTTALQKSASQLQRRGKNHSLVRVDALFFLSLRRGNNVLLFLSMSG